MARVALYGGAFDPPHIAHLFAVTALLARDDVDAVWLLPAADHVFGKRMTPFAERVEMLRAAAAGLAAEVCEVEAERAGESRSFDTLTLLSERHPEHRFMLALGADNLAERHRWYRFDDLVARWPVVAFDRPGYSRALDAVRDEPWCRPAVPLPAISSTEIRAALRGGGDPGALAWLPDAIRDRAARLYGGSVEGGARVQVVGAGRCGRALASALRGAGWPVRVWNRRASPHADATGPLTGLPAAPLWLLCVSDGALPEVATRLAGHAGISGSAMLHCAARLGRDVLAPLADVGAETGSIHPLQSLRGDGRDRLRGAFCAIEGTAAATSSAERLARAMGATPVGLPPGTKGAYHAAAVLAANFCTTLGAGGVAVLSALGIPPQTARDMLVPLLRGTIEHFADTEGAAALTGPFSRGDLEAVAAHVRALQMHGGEWVAPYEAMARATAAWLGWDAERRAELEAVLSPPRPADG